MKQGPIYYKDDFNFILRLHECGSQEDIGWPEYDWEARLWTASKAECYVAGCRNGVATNCYNDGGAIRVVVNDHRLRPGKLKVDFVAWLPNDSYPDGSERIVVASPLEIELSDREHRCPSAVEVELMLPYIQGKPFRYEDFTQAQLDDLRRPAVEAAEALMERNREYGEREELRNAAELSRLSSEQSRGNAERLRETGESSRAEAELERRSAENARSMDEAGRAASEENRRAAELIRLDNELLRGNAEGRRCSEEQLRVAAEAERKSREAGRSGMEQGRCAAEESRVAEEAGRVSAEAGRAAAEALRQRGEATREKAEDEREEAERRRAVEFGGWLERIDSKADISQLSNVLAADPLDPVEQADMPEYRRVFVEMWSQACGRFGGYNATTDLFVLNGLEDMTYEEAVGIYVDSIGAKAALSTKVGMFSMYPHRTHLPFMNNTSDNITNLFSGASDLVVANLTSRLYDNPMPALDSYGVFNNCTRLRSVIGALSLHSSNTRYPAFTGCESLEDIKINGIARNLSIKDSPRLSLDSAGHMVRNATNTSAITITVHPDVYAKLTDESNKAWHRILTEAADRNIQFAI